MVLVVALAIVFPVCYYFFGNGSSQASRSRAPNKITVDGKDIVGQGSASYVKCEQVGGDTVISIGGPSGDGDVGGPSDDGRAVVTPDNQVVSVSFTQTEKDTYDKYPLWSWDGDATVTQSGNTYKITGNIRPTWPMVERTDPPEPFEFDATCP